MITLGLRRYSRSCDSHDLWNAAVICCEIQWYTYSAHEQQAGHSRHDKLYIRKAARKTRLCRSTRDNCLGLLQGLRDRERELWTLDTVRMYLLLRDST